MRPRGDETMNVAEAMQLIQETLKLTIMLASPMLVFGIIAGLLVSIFQTVTSIHEMTLTFVPKILAVVVGLFIFLPWILQKIMSFTTHLFLSAGR
jgi:flagellar biosynthetic protein FliQ